MLGPVEQRCSELVSDLTHAVVQATDMYSQVKILHSHLMLLADI